MANSEDVVWMACESHLRRFGHVANCAPCLAVTLDYVRAEVRELRRDRDEEHDRRLDWRGIDPGDECSACGGAGSRAYGSTATWRGGIGGQAITSDVCNRCWGSGSKTHRWPSHRAAMGGGEGEQR